MLWWEEGFCRMLAEGGRFVIRYDHRDTGRSTTYEVGHPGYTASDLAADAVAVLDGFGISAAHVVGVSAGGAFAQLLALDHPERVLTLVLISTSPATSGDRQLPGPTPGVHAVRGDRGRGLVGRRVGDRVSGRILPRARGTAAPVRREDGPRARSPRRRAREEVRGKTEPQRYSRRSAPHPSPSRRLSRRRWSSTVRPTRCSRSSTARRWPSRFRARGCSRSRGRSRR